MRVCRAILAIMVCICVTATGQSGDWPSYQGGDDSNQYAPYDQINRDNVHRLEEAWTYHTGDMALNNRSQLQVNPIIIGGRFYGYTPLQKVVCLDAATGEAIWVFSPYEGEAPTNATSVKRGVAYWTDGKERRILCTALSELLAIDADTGRLIESFGTGGRVDLHVGLRPGTEDLYVGSTSPGRIYKDLIILGTRVSEGNPSAPGDIRAFDVRTGELRWSFHTIPHPGEFGYDTWPKDAWQRAGGANCWAGMSLDAERGVVYVPTGSAAFDFYGADRHGDNLFANCVLALDAATGKRLWHYQIVRHDVWDRDLPAPPNLVTVVHDGRHIDAVAQITKSAHVFLFDRDTGKPLFPIEERAVPASDLPGERLSPTQPIPLKPPAFGRQILTEDELTDISPEARASVVERFRAARSTGQFEPPSEQGTVIFPGFDGGGEWGGAAFDPETGLLYVNGNEMAWILTMVDKTKRQGQSLGETVYRDNCMLCHGPQGKGNEVGMPPVTGLEKLRTRDEVREVTAKGKGFMPAFDFLNDAELKAVVDLLFNPEALAAVTVADAATDAQDDRPRAYTHTGYNRFFDAEGYPAIKPPWGVLAAIDLNKGETAWQIPLGEFEELTKRGIPPTGTENYGGPCVTKGGLIFIAATQDEQFRAFDKTTGELLWQADLPAGGYATPSTYMVDGRQFVVIAAGGGKMGTKSGDAYVAFALPEE